jgi:Tryptophan-associated transmembrane protein (Trp_oprn_chp)
VPERITSRQALVVTIAVLIAASAALGGSAALGWARMDFQSPLHGFVQRRLTGSAVLSAVGPLAVLALAAVAAVVATSGRVRWLLGAMLLGAAVLLSIGVLRVFNDRWLTATAIAAADRPARSVPVGTATVLPVGPVLAMAGAALLAVAGLVLVVGGHRMPRLGRRYQAPKARRDGQLPPEGQLWERLDAGEDPTSGHPR